MSNPSVHVSLELPTGETDFVPLIAIPRVNEFLIHNEIVYRISAIIHSPPNQANPVAAVTVVLELP